MEVRIASFEDFTPQYESCMTHYLIEYFSSQFKCWISVDEATIFALLIKMSDPPYHLVSLPRNSIGRFVYISSESISAITTKEVHNVLNVGIYVGKLLEGLSTWIRTERVWTK